MSAATSLNILVLAYVTVPVSPVGVAFLERFLGIRRINKMIEFQELTVPAGKKECFCVSCVEAVQASKPVGTFCSIFNIYVSLLSALNPLILTSLFPGLSAAKLYTSIFISHLPVIVGGYLSHIRILNTFDGLFQTK